MKKSIKFWIAALSLLAMTTATFISTSKVEAWTNKLTLTISAFNNWVNTCTWSDYTYNLTASTTSQTVTDKHDITCKLWETTSKNITLQLSWDLKWASTNVVIPSSGIKLTNTGANRTSTPSDLGTWKAVSNATFSTAQTLYSKNQNKIWTTTWTNVQIGITVPGWTPQDTYNWTIVLTY